MESATQVRLYAADARGVDEAALARLAQHLDAQESARAARFVFDKHRRRFTVAHGFLREVLARELDRAPRDLGFEHGPFGKPRLVNAALHFSLTHTGEHALVALGERELGLDAEEVRAARVDEALAARVMTAREFEDWSRAARESQVRAFFQLWSAKESVMKASGRGLDLGPQTFGVFAPGTLEVGGSVAIDRQAWAVRTLPSPSDFALALATRGEASITRCDWPFEVR